MLPLIPKSVKMEPEVSRRLKASASQIGYSENQFIVESVKGILDVAEDFSNAVPRIVILLRSARSHLLDPGHFGEMAGVGGRDGVKWWG